MKRAVDVDEAFEVGRAFGGMLLAVAFLELARAMVACGGAQPTPAQQADVTEYGLEQQDCVRTSATLEESRACRERVRARYGRADAGSSPR